MAISNSGQFSKLNQGMNNLNAFLDIFGVSREAQSQYYSDIQSAMDQMADEEANGKVVLSDGTKVDMKTISGMTVFTVHLQILQANMELINNILGFVKNFESKLENMLGG